MSFTYIFLPNCRAMNQTLSNYFQYPVLKNKFIYTCYNKHALLEFWISPEKCENIDYKTCTKVNSVKSKQEATIVGYAT